ncbi:MAG: AsmA family protein [Steroidobacteraceae bacterium]
MSPALILLAFGLVAAANAGYGRTLLIRFAAAHIHRPVQVKGTLQLHLFSRTPRVVADDVIIDNPPWMPAGRAAQIGRLTLVMTLPGFDHKTGIIEFEANGVTLDLQRDADGRANWQLTDPPKRGRQSESTDCPQSPGAECARGSQ